MNQNVSASGEPMSAHAGYLSEESKKQFTITAGILGAVFFFLQMFTPFIAIILIIPAVVLGSLHMKKYEFGRGGVRENHLYFFVEKEGPGAGAGSAKLVRIDLAEITAADTRESGGAGRLFPRSKAKQDVEIEEIAEVDGGSAWVLAKEDRLLVVSKNEIRELSGGKLVSLGSYAALGNISRPFFYRGLPAVLEERPKGIFLSVFEDGAWQRTDTYLAEEARNKNVESSFQVLTVDGTNHVFLKAGDAIFHRVGFPHELSPGSTHEWQSVGDSVYRWQSFVLENRPAILLWSRNGIRGYRMEGEEWKQLFQLSEGLYPDSFLALPKPDGTVMFAASSMPFSGGIYSVGKNMLVLNSRFGRGFPFPPMLMALIFVPQLISMLFPLILAVALSGLMLRHRVSTHAFAGETAQFAPLTRRALAQIIDGTIVSAGMLPFVSQFFNMFEMMEIQMNTFMFPIYFFGKMALFFGWSFLLLLVFSLMEGSWGMTPGKWFLGIRVVGADLQPCGFWRALLRNFLKVVDGFFNFMVGILVVAFTTDWQRVGDMAARTIVIRNDSRVQTTNYTN